MSDVPIQIVSGHHDICSWLVTALFSLAIDTTYQHNGIRTFWNISCLELCSVLGSELNLVGICKIDLLWFCLLKEFPKLPGESEVWYIHVSKPPITFDSVCLLHWIIVWKFFVLSHDLLLWQACELRIKFKTNSIGTIFPSACQYLRLLNLPTWQLPTLISSHCYDSTEIMISLLLTFQSQCQRELLWIQHWGNLSEGTGSLKASHRVGVSSHFLSG